MRFYQLILILLFAFQLSACGESAPPQTPLDALKTYTQAIKKKDTAKMKTLLSKGSIKMAEDEARERNLPLDEVIQKETLFSEDQKTVEFRNEKIEGETATIEMKNSYGTWDVVPSVRENGKWKIAKERYADELMKQAEEDNKRLDEQIIRGRQP